MVKPRTKYTSFYHWSLIKTRMKQPVFMIELPTLWKVNDIRLKLFVKAQSFPRFFFSQTAQSKWTGIPLDSLLTWLQSSFVGAVLILLRIPSSTLNPNEVLCFQGHFFWHFTQRRNLSLYQQFFGFNGKPHDNIKCHPISPCFSYWCLVENGGNGIIFTSDYGSFPHSLRSTHKFCFAKPQRLGVYHIYISYHILYIHTS